MEAQVMVNGQSVPYHKFVAALFKNMGTDSNNLMHAAIGISGEAGELLDAVKKLWAYSKPLDRANTIEELGDIEFYLQAMRNQLGLRREEILQANAAKLSVRYSSGTYSDAQAQARADKEQA